MWQALTFQACDQIFCSHGGHFIARLITGAGNVRGNQDVIQLQQWMARPNGFGLGHIESGEGNGTGRKSAIQRLGIDHGTARCID